MEGTYYLNNNGSRWVTFPKEKVLVIEGVSGYCKLRTISHYEMYGNFYVVCFKWQGKMIKRFVDVFGDRKVVFIDFKDRY